MNRTRVAVGCAIVLLTALRAPAGPVEVILQVVPAPEVVMIAYGDLGLQAIQEQFPGGLQSTLSGNVRVRFDPANPNSIEFLPSGSHLDLSHSLLVALPGFTPANFAGYTPGLPFFAIRGMSFDLSSGALSMTPQGISHRFVTDDISARFIQGTYQSDAPSFRDLRHLSMGTNTWGIDGSFTWFPTTPGDNLFVTVPIQYRYQPSGTGSSDQILFFSNLRMFASFSLDNVADVGPEGGAVEVLGGASTPGGVSATITGVTEAGSFTAQQIGLEGLPAGALEQALLVPDLAYSLGLVDYTTPIWNLNFTGEAAGMEITLGFTEYTTPNWSESQLALYHFNSLGEWERVAGQILDTQANTIRFTAVEFSPFMLAVVPEPGGVVYAVLGLVGLAGAAVRRRSLRSKQAV